MKVFEIINVEKKSVLSISENFEEVILKLTKINVGPVLAINCIGEFIGDIIEDTGSLNMFNISSKTGDRFFILSDNFMEVAKQAESSNCDKIINFGKPNCLDVNFKRVEVKNEEGNSKVEETQNENSNEEK